MIDTSMECKVIKLKSTYANFFFLIIILHNYRGRRNTYHHTTLLKLDAVNDTDASNFYLGKKVAFIYKSKVAKAGSKFRGAYIFQ